MCDGSAEDVSLPKKDREEANPENKIFLNFNHNCADAEMDCYRINKVKQLFRLLGESSQLQDLKLSGWSEEKTERDSLATTAEEEEEGKEREDNDLPDLEVGCQNRASGGQRFALSRDFWYRKLNVLKALKLDEVALETKDMPPREGCGRAIGGGSKVFADEVREKSEDVAEEIRQFESRMVEPTEKFVNIYDNRVHFCQK